MYKNGLNLDIWPIDRSSYAANYNINFIPTGPISTTPEMPTAADMQLAAAVGSKGK